MIVFDLARTLFSVLSVIVIIIVSRKFVKILEKAIEGVISNETLFQIIGLKTITIAISFLPAALFISILMVIGRMYRDQEMSAVFSAGGGAWTIYRAVFLLVFPVMLLATAASLYLGPWAEATTKELMFNDQKTADLRGIAAGRFTEFQHGNLVFYVEEIDQDNKLQQVFVQSLHKDKLGVVTADSGRMENLPGGFYMVLENGRRIQGKPGEKNYSIEEFKEYGVRLDEQNSVLTIDVEAMASYELWFSADVKNAAEFLRRMFIPAGVIFLSLLAVPLAQISPRGGVYGNMLIAFLIYFSYGNLVRVSLSWVVKEKIPFWLGGVWVYLVVLIVAGALLVRLYGTTFVWMKIKEKVLK